MNASDNMKFYRKKGLDYAGPCSSIKNDGELCGISPTALKNHYGIRTEYSGKGIKVGIILAYGSGTEKEDLEMFCDRFSLAHTNINVLLKQSEKRLDSSVKWITEASIDIQWVHAFAPEAEIICYIAGSDDLEDIVNVYSKADEDCDIILCSFGKTEFAGQTYYEPLFENSKALTVCASGNRDSVFFPACAKNVLSVGGTSLLCDLFGVEILNETTWKESGGGVSKYVQSTWYQKELSNIYDKRSVPDIAFFADGGTGVAVCVDGRFVGCHGTSVSAACVAGLCACVAQKKGDILTKKASFFYELALKDSNYKKHFLDIKNGHSGKRVAVAGYDLCTGLGVPKFESLLF